MDCKFPVPWLVFIFIMSLFALGSSESSRSTPLNSNSETVPVEFSAIMDSLLHGQDHSWLSNNGFSGSIQFGNPVHFHGFKADLLKRGENARVKDIIEPLNQWAVPVLSQDGRRGWIIIEKNQSQPAWHISGLAGPAVSWNRIERAWPVTAGFHPVFIGCGFGPAYFYVPEKGDRNLTSLYFSSNGRRRSEADTSYVSLDSSRIWLNKIIGTMNAASNTKGYGLSD